MQCRHCGTKLSRKDLNGTVVTCPQCGARFRLKGKKKQSRKRTRKETMILIIAEAVLIALLAVTVIALYHPADTAIESPVSEEENIPLLTPVPEATPAPTPEPTPLATATPYEAASVHFRVVGDIIVHQHQLDVARQSDGSYDFYPAFELIKDSLSNADFTIGNLETSITKNNFKGYPEFRTPVSLLDALKDAGFDMFTLSNNHILDGNLENLKYELDELDARGLDHIGVYRTQEEADAPYIKEINGIRFGFLAYTYGVNGNRLGKIGKYGKFVVKTLGASDFKKDVQTLRDAGAEMIICLPHWGTEYRKVPTEAQEDACRKLAAAGVDIILGSHPHIVQKVQTFTKTTELGEQTNLLCWSLGNFVNNAKYDYADCGIIMDFTVERDPMTGLCTVKDIAYVPVYVWNDKGGFHVICIGEYYDNKPEDMRKNSFDRMKSNINRIKKQAGTDVGVLEK